MSAIEGQRGECVNTVLRVLILSNEKAQRCLVSWILSGDIKAF